MLLLKESNIEMCQNMYALSMNYLKNNDDIELKLLLEYLYKLEVAIRECNDNKVLNDYIRNLGFLCDKIEVIINE